MKFLKNIFSVYTLIAAIFFLILPATAQSRGGTPLDKDFSLFLDWFPGRYDNSLQTFWEPDLNVPEHHRHGRIHSIFREVNLPKFGDNVFYVEQYQDGNRSDIYRQRIYVFTTDKNEKAIRLTIHSPKNPEKIQGAYKNLGLLKKLKPNDTIVREGCDVFWKRQSNQFIGYMKEGACRFTSKRSGEVIVITDDLVLTKNEIWIRDKAETADGKYVFGNKADIHHKLRKVRAFECWTSRLRGAKHGDSGEGNDNWFFKTGGWIHDQGGELRLTGGEDFPNDTRLILRRMEWPTGSSRSSLVLYAYEGDTDRATSYSWTEYDSERIGLNLRWLQASCTHKSERLYEDGE